MVEAAAVYSEPARHRPEVGSPKRSVGDDGGGGDAGVERRIAERRSALAGAIVPRRVQRRVQWGVGITVWAIAACVVAYLALSA